MEKAIENQVLKKIGSKVRENREKMQWSQRKLAEKVLVSPSCITRLEKGESMVSIFTLISIADTLQIPLSFLVSEKLEFDMKELEHLARKIAYCPQEQRLALIQSFEDIIDSFFMDS